jgi:hypothetical protein
LNPQIRARVAAVPQVAVWSASEGNGADASIVAISRYSRSTSA